MLQALYEQATSQLAAAEKLRNMESGLTQLQSTTVGLAERAQTAVPAGTQSPAPGSVVPVSPQAPQAPLATQPPAEGAGDEKAARGLDVVTAGQEVQVIPARFRPAKNPVDSAGFFYVYYK